MPTNFTASVTDPASSPEAQLTGPELAAKPPAGTLRRWQIASAVAILLVCVLAIEWYHNLELSLGVLYVLPLLAATTILSRWQIVVAALLCAWFRTHFTPDLSPAEFWLRFLMASLAYGGSALLVSEVGHSRRRVLAVYSRLQAERERRHRAEDQLRILVESSPAAIMTVNYLGEIVAANRAAHRILGFADTTSLLGRHIGDFVPVFVGALHLGQTDTLVHASSTSWARRADGVQFPVSAWFSTHGDDRNLYLSGILVDTSEEVRDRERETFRCLNVQSRLLAGAVSHEIRNLCSAVRVVTSNLARRPGLSEDADFKALQTLTEGLSRVASFELKSRSEGASDRTDVAQLLEQLRIVIEPDWLDIDGKIYWDVPPHLPRVTADEHSLLQIFLNLSLNSLRAVQQEPERRLEVRTRVEKGKVVVRFQDSGPGVPDPSLLFRAFQPDSDGSGLGLYISRTVSRSFGGDLAYLLGEGGGCFELSVPVHE